MLKKSLQIFDVDDERECFGKRYGQYRICKSCGCREDCKEALEDLSNPLTQVLMDMGVSYSEQIKNKK